MPCERAGLDRRSFRSGMNRLPPLLVLPTRDPVNLGMVRIHHQLAQHTPKQPRAVEDRETLFAPLLESIQQS